jgi:hypothetical protein
VVVGHSGSPFHPFPLALQYPEHWSQGQ